MEMSPKLPHVPLVMSSQMYPNILHKNHSCVQILCIKITNVSKNIGKQLPQHRVSPRIARIVVFESGKL